LLLFKLLKLIW